MVRTISFLNTKGGAGKTTTALGIAATWKALGYRVGVVDVDPNGSASAWLAEWPELDGTPGAADMLPELVRAAADLYDYLVIDTPPNDQATIALVAHVSDLVVIPSAPTAIEFQQLASTIALVTETGTPWIIAPVKVRMSTNAGRQVRDTCDLHELPATRAVIPLTEQAAQAFGTEPPRLTYSAMARELLSIINGEQALPHAG